MLAEAITARVAKLYEAENEQACPGEDNCETFRTSAADQPPEARCPSCPKLLGSSEPAKVTTRSDDEALIDQLQRLVSERDSGFGFPVDLTQLEKELVMLWDETVAVFERAHQARVNQMFEVIMSMSKANG